MRLPRLTYANVVSTLCLFLLLGGGAYAATKLPKNSVGTGQLKKNAVTGAKVKNGSLTGADVRVATLGQVPSAAHASSADSAARADAATRADPPTRADSAGHADTAGDAATLDGKGAAAFLPAANLPRIDYAANWSSEPAVQRPILRAGALTLYGLCIESEEGAPRDTSFGLSATGASGATVDYASINGSSPEAGDVEVGPSSIGVLPAFTSGPDAIQDAATLVYRDGSSTISVSLGIHVSTEHTCRVRGMAVVAG